MTGDPVYFWFPVSDTGRAQTFFGGLFGWEFAPGNAPDGFQITNTSPPGGIHGGEKGSAPGVCFGVEDMEAAIARVRELGGDADAPNETSAGSYAMCTDDQGTTFCIWAPTAE